jgi:hypothetical protein
VLEQLGGAEGYEREETEGGEFEDQQRERPIPALDEGGEDQDRGKELGGRKNKPRFSRSGAGCCGHERALVWASAG